MHQIPAIEYNEEIKTSSGVMGNNFITVNNNTGLVVGKIIYGSQIPNKSKITNIVGNSVYFDNTVQANFVDEDLGFYDRFDFRYPAEKGSDNGEYKEIDDQTSTSLTGDRQVILNYIEALREMTFSFLTLAEKDLLENEIFIGNLARGKTIRFFQDKDLLPFQVYEKNSKAIGVQRLFPKNGDFLYRVSLSFRRIY